MVICLFLFDLILYFPFNNFQLCLDGSSWVEPVLSWDLYVLLKEPLYGIHNPSVLHSSTVPLHSPNGTISGLNKYMILKPFTRQIIFSKTFHDSLQTSMRHVRNAHLIKLVQVICLLLLIIFLIPIICIFLVLFCIILGLVFIVVCCNQLRFTLFPISRSRFIFGFLQLQHR